MAETNKRQKTHNTLAHTHKQESSQINRKCTDFFYTKHDMTGLSYTKNVVCVQIICAFIVVIVYLSTAEGVINIFFSGNSKNSLGKYQHLIKWCDAHANINPHRHTRKCGIFRENFTLHSHTILY